MSSANLLLNRRRQQPAASASEVTTVWRYRNPIIIIIIIIGRWTALATIRINCHFIPPLYPVSQKSRTLYTLVHNFGKC